MIAVDCGMQNLDQHNFFAGRWCGDFKAAITGPTDASSGWVPSGGRYKFSHGAAGKMSPQAKARDCTGWKACATGDF